LKNIKILEKKSLVSQIINAVESLSGRLDQIEDRISGLEDKAAILEHSNEDRGKKLKCKWSTFLWETIKDQIYKSWEYKKRYKLQILRTYSMK